MMKQTEDAGEKMGVCTWIDLLSGACFISLSYACGRFHTHAVVIRFLLLCLLFFLPALLAIRVDSRAHMAVNGILFPVRCHGRFAAYGLEIGPSLYP
jgi:hypothetical protein